MYEERFGLSGPPFRLNPDPKFFFGSRSHNKAMAYLHYGLRQGEGFIVITGEIGAGKSMLIGHLLDQLDRSNIVAANLLTSNLEPSALLAHILSAFRIEPAGTGKSAEIEALEDFLFDQMNRGRRVLLIVDEAQNLPVKTIEELRMLSNMAYDGTPLFQVFLVGQPEFREQLARPEMEQLRQRVIAAYHLAPLDGEETRDYILHRLRVVGWNDNPRVDPDAFASIYAATGGVPRRINTLCNRLLLYCGLENLGVIDERVVSDVVREMTSETEGARGKEIAAEPDDQANRPVDERRPTAEIVRLFAQDGAASEESRAKREAPDAAPDDRFPTGAPDVAPPPPVAAAPVSHTPTRPGAATATTAVESGEVKSMSMFDRLKAIKSGSPMIPPETAPVLAVEAASAPPNPPAPQSATLADVARAIADVSPQLTEESARVEEREVVEAFDAPADSPPDADPAVDAAEPPLVAEHKGWRQAMLASINETRDELKTAHAQVARMRREVSELDRRRAERHSRVTENLDKAESILNEMRNAWR